MRRYWFVTNARSGSTAETVAAEIRDTLSAMGHDMAGRTGFPDDALPSPDLLARAGVEWMVVYAGDGTVNAVLTALHAWDGAILILPGGTMNLLATTLHGEHDAMAILRRLTNHPPRRVSLPFAEADGHHAYAGLILGPATRWAAAREAVRDGRIGRLILAVRLAWRRSFGTGLRLAGVPALPRRYQAVFVTPHSDRLDLAAVDARTWQRLFDLGRMALTDDWTNAQGVTRTQSPGFRVAGRGGTPALFDGEPHRLPAGAEVTLRHGPANIIATSRGQAPWSASG